MSYSDLLDKRHPNAVNAKPNILIRYGKSIWMYDFSAAIVKNINPCLARKTMLLTYSVIPILCIIIGYTVIIDWKQVIPIKLAHMAVNET